MKSIVGERNRSEVEFDDEVVKKIIADYEYGKGLDVIAKELNVDRRHIKDVLQQCNVKLRGPGVKTKWISEIRSKNLKERIAKFGNNHTLKSRMGVNGWYWNKSIEKWVWLRSSYEYIYAKWLDKNNFIWKVEVTQEKIEGRWYRPDFFIYRDKSCEELLKVVEIKSEYTDKIQKYRSLRISDFKGVKVERIYDSAIETFIEEGLTYSNMLREWKVIGRSNKQIRDFSVKKEKEEKRLERIVKKEIKYEIVKCLSCGIEFKKHKASNQKTCNDKKCVYECMSNAVHKTHESRREKQKKEIIELFCNNDISLTSNFESYGRKTLQEFYPLLKEHGLPVHINTLRLMFNVESLCDIMEILEREKKNRKGKENVPIVRTAVC